MDLTAAFSVIMVAALGSFQWYQYAYFGAVIAMFGFSSFFHWVPHSETVRKIDHSFIYVLIACTVLPYWPEHVAYENLTPLLALIIAAVVGVVAKVVFGISSRFISGSLYALVGLLSVFVMRHIDDYVDEQAVATFWFGVLLYAVQLLIYSKKWFDFRKGVFGYREVQHVVLILAAALHISLVI